MSENIKEKSKNLSISSSDRVLVINRPKIKEIFRWSSALKEKDPYTRSQGEEIVELLKRNLSPVSQKDVSILIKVDELKTLIWWQELSGVSTDLTPEVLTLLKNTRDNIKPDPTNPSTT